MKYLLLYNPISGKGKFKNKIPKIEAIFKKYNHSLDIYESKFSGDLKSYAEKMAPFYDVFLVAGGDGTIHEVVNGVMHSDKKPALSFLPCGTANDTAAILGIRKNIKRNIERTLTDEPIKTDINQANDRYFIYTLAAGSLTKISYDISRESVKKYGYIAYLISGVKDIFKKYTMQIKVTHDKGTISGIYTLVLGLTGNRVGGITMNKFSKAKLNDGKLEMRLIKTTKFLRILRLLWVFITFGSKTKDHDHLLSSKYYLETSDDVVWNTDGERYDTGNMNVVVHKEALELFVSKRCKRNFYIK